MRSRSPLQDKLNPPPLNLDEDLGDDELFRRAMADVVRLPQSPLPTTIRRRHERASGRRNPTARELIIEALADDSDAQWLYAGDYVEGGAQHPSELLLRKLRSGGFSVQAELDLHGLSRDEALQRLETFVRESCHRNLTCVRIVHGKGRNSPNQVPVLKNQIERWLSLRRLARRVIAYTTARPVDGGAGALYLLLGEAVRPKGRKASSQTCSDRPR